MEEKLVDVMNFDPQSADSFEHYAFSCYLEKTEDLPISTSFLMERSSDTAEAMFEKQDWIKACWDKMQQYLDVGFMEGYLKLKTRYERMLEQHDRVKA